MASILIDRTEVTISPSGFSSKKRYLRKKTGGTLAMSAGRTWTVSVSGGTNTGQPYIGFRFNMAGLVPAINRLSFTVSGSTTTALCPDVNPIVDACTI